MSIKKIMAGLTLPLALFFLCQPSFCQENFLPGYIVSPRGDTMAGFIDYRNWERNPERIFYKEKPGDEKSGYSPMDIKGFGVLDEQYESAVMDVESSPVTLGELQYNSQLVIVKDTAFLQTMVRGAKSLYFYKDKLGKEMFYIRQDSAFDLLIYKRYLKEEAGETVIAENKKYIGQLTIYLSNCASIQKELNGAAYQKNSLEKLFLSYFACTRSGIEFHKKTEKISVEAGVMAGASLTWLKFRSEAFPELVYADYPPSVNFSGGFFLDVILARNLRKWSICNELTWSSYKVNGSYTDYLSQYRYTVTATTLGYSYLKMNNLVRFKYPIGKVFIYLNAGVSNGYAIIEKNYAKVESTLLSQVTVKEGKALNETRRYELGFIAGLGAKFKKLSFEIRYENANGMSTYIALNSSTNRFYGLLGYRF